ncbi:DciA family protein [Psychrobacter sp. B38]|uniref:DciA family protein n=1 Tax=Psychrobacter sp. B38 TaxID=3143538 RepID=UPI00320DA887
MSKKQPNRLAQLIDHQAFAGSALPQTLADNMRLYIKATNEVKELLIDCLPEEILNTCWVVGLTSEQLILSVESTTAANHIRYLQSAYLRVLAEQSITFKQLKQIRVIVAKTSADNSLTKPASSLSAINSKSLAANENKALSQNTKRTISQAAEHVTTDEKLKKALLRLIND